jgi:hypothetical protein
MCYAYLLFWPANVLPIYLLITLLQIFIPLTYLVRSIAVGMTVHRKHQLAAFIILIAVGVNSGVLAKNWPLWGQYYLMFLGAAAFDVISTTMKESIVRS